MDKFTDKQKAIDLALWQNYNHRYDDNYGVVETAKSEYIVCKTNDAKYINASFEALPKDHSKMDYGHIQSIRTDDDPLNHWEEIAGMFSVAHGETLRYILFANVPLERFIRYELASRGYDKDFKWVGFEEAENIWFKE
jgi:hypothetical protein